MITQIKKKIRFICRNLTFFFIFSFRAYLIYYSRYNCLKLVFNNIGQHILYVKAGCTHLLGNKARRGHARSSIYFEHINFIVAVLVFRYDIVDTYNSVCPQDVIYTACFSSHLLCGFC